MASCRNCIHWIICSKTDGTTHYYGKENAVGNVETLCTDFRNTTNFVPKSEIEQIFAEIEKFRGRTPFGYICFSIDEFEEIKKKYTEEQK